jgi:hypothetical protein
MFLHKKVSRKSFFNTLLDLVLMRHRLSPGRSVIPTEVSNSTSQTYLVGVEASRAGCSMRRHINSYDNATMESFESLSSMPP